MFPVSYECPHPTHSLFQLVSQQSESIAQNQTLRTRFVSVVNPYLTNDTNYSTEYDYVIKDINHKALQIAIQNQPLKPILEDIQPEVNPVENFFYMAEITALSQLRSE